MFKKCYLGCVRISEKVGKISRIEEKGARIISRDHYVLQKFNFLD